MIRLYRRVMAWAGDAWGWGMVTIFFLMFLVLVGFFFNWIGLGGINFTVIFFLIPVLFGLLVAPDITVNLLAAAVVSGMAQQPQIRGEIEAFFKTYLNFVKGIVLGLLLIFIFLAVVPVAEKPIGFFALLAVVLAIILSASFWGFKGTWGKKLTYWALIIIFVLSFGKLIPNDVYRKYVGVIPAEIFGRSETEKALQEVEEQLSRNADEAQAEKLEQILGKVKSSKKALSAGEQAELDEARKEVGEKSLPAQIKKIGGKIFSFSAPSKRSWLLSFTGEGQKKIKRTKDLPPGNYTINPVEGVEISFNGINNWAPARDFSLTQTTTVFARSGKEVTAILSQK